MTSEKRALLERRADAYLQKAEEVHKKWNANTWTRARHLLGVLTDSKRRCWFAAELLSLLKLGQVKYKV